MRKEEGSIFRYICQVSLIQKIRATTCNMNRVNSFSTRSRRSFSLSFLVSKKVELSQATLRRRRVSYSSSRGISTIEVVTVCCERSIAAWNSRPMEFHQFYDAPISNGINGKYGTLAGMNYSKELPRIPSYCILFLYTLVSKKQIAVNRFESFIKTNGNVA